MKTINFFVKVNKNQARLAKYATVGAGVGVATSLAVGGMGLALMGTAVGIGVATMGVVGAVCGVAVKGVVDGMEETQMGFFVEL